MKVLEVVGEAEKVLTDICDGALAHFKFSGGGHALVSKLMSLFKEVPDPIQESKIEEKK